MTKVIENKRFYGVALQGSNPKEAFLTLKSTYPRFANIQYYLINGECDVDANEITQLLDNEVPIMHERKCRMCFLTNGEFFFFVDKNFVSPTHVYEEAEKALKAWHGGALTDEIMRGLATALKGEDNG